MYSRSSGSGRMNCPSVILTLVVLSWSWSSFLIIPTEAVTADEVSVALDEATDLIARPDIITNEKDIEQVVGRLPFHKYDSPPPDNVWYDNLRLAYHFNVYGSRFYDRGRVLMKWWDELMTRIRRYQLVWQNLKDLVNTCTIKRQNYDAVKATNPDGEEMKTFVSNCSSLVETMLIERDLYELELHMEKGVIYAYQLIASFIHVACYQGTNNYRFNGKIITNKAKGPQIGLFNRMNKEYLELGDELQKLKGDFDAHLTQVGPVSTTPPSPPYVKMINSAATKINKKLAATPFDVLYIRDAAQRKLLHDQVADWKFCSDFHVAVSDNAHFVDEHKFSFDFDLDMTYYFDMHNNRGVWKQFNQGLDEETAQEKHDSEVKKLFVRLYGWGKIPAVKPAIVKFYNDFMRVRVLPPTAQAKMEDFETWDGKWNWELAGTGPKNILHRMRLGTDLLDSVVEELKCYLNLTFTKEKRDEMVKNYTSSADWENAKLYNLISETYARPCETANETDLVGTCTRENHEICIPMYYNTVFQDPLNNIKGGMSLMKPKWYFRKMADGTCQGKRTYITHYKICQCGFRTDCGSDLKGNPDITCQFVENDLIRKQCRGSIAYPCKSHPFEKGKYHETCATGFCDLDENSCERWHWHIFE